MNINRRRFLQHTLATASMVSCPTLATTKNKLGVALLGLGYYSNDVLAPALQLTKHCKLAGIVTGSPEKIPRWQQRYGIPDKNVYDYDTLNTIANNSSIDVIYVVTPTSTHLKYAIAAAQAGKHVWCEKPMAMTVAECQEMIDVCARNGVKLSIGYRMQHEPNTRLFSRFQREQRFGKLKALSAYAGYGGSAQPQDYWRMQRAMGGGALYDMGVYCINGARFISGQEPIAVKARIEKADGFKEVDSSTYFSLKFANGFEAECGTSVVKHFNYLRADCKQGWYELRPMQSYSGVTGLSSDGKSYPSYTGNQQALQMDNDALAIINKSPVLVPGIEGLKDIHIVNKAFESAYSDQGYKTL